jgi:hypothetical protein
MVRAVLGRAILAVVMTVLALTACSGPTTTGQATTAMVDALEEASSAVETVDLTITLLAAGRLSDEVADASVLDQIGVLEQSATALGTLVPPAELGQARADAEAALATAGAAVVEARAWVNGVSAPSAPATAAEVLAGLETASGDLQDALSGVRP